MTSADKVASLELSKALRSMTWADRWLWAREPVRVAISRVLSWTIVSVNLTDNGKSRYGWM